MKESIFQSKLIREIKDRFNGCVILKNDADYIQGFPDLTIFYKNKWAVLEVKQSFNSHHQPNQDYFVNYLNEMSFSRFIFPENKDEVLKELERFFA